MTRKTTTRKTTSINRLRKIEDGALILISSDKKGVQLQDANAQVATFDKKTSFNWVSRHLPFLGDQQVVLASLI